MATLRSPLAAVGVDPADRTAVDAPAHRLQRRMRSSAASFGAPVTDPGGNVAVDERRPSRRRTAAGPARCSRDGRAPGASSTATATGPSPSPSSHTRPRSLRTRSTIITFSARSLSVQAGRRGGPLDRRRQDHGRRRGAGTARATPRQRTASGGDAHDRAERRRVALGESGPERCDAHLARDRRAEGVGDRDRESSGEVHLVHVARGDRFPDGIAPGFESGLVERRRPAPDAETATTAQATCGPGEPS